MINEVEENRRILAAIAGARIPGGCYDCDAYSVVHYGGHKPGGQDMDPAPDLLSGVFRLAVYHTETCPTLRSKLGGG